MNDPRPLVGWLASRDRVGMSYDEVGGCWGLVMSVLAEMGYEVPADPALALGTERPFARALGPGEGARIGDVLEMLGADGVSHVAVVVSGFDALHATREGGVVRHRLAALLRSGGVVRVLRPMRRMA